MEFPSAPPPFRYIGGPWQALEVMHEQLDELDAHYRKHSVRGCPECQRYIAVYDNLLWVFIDHGKAKAANA